MANNRQQMKFSNLVDNLYQKVFCNNSWPNSIFLSAVAYVVLYRDYFPFFLLW